ncbi:unnamed protein product, partial [Prunus brigantina]
MKEAGLLGLLLTLQLWLLACILHFLTHLITHNKEFSHNKGTEFEPVFCFDWSNQSHLLFCFLLVWVSKLLLEKWRLSHDNEYCLVLIVYPRTVLDFVLFFIIK